MTTSSTAVVLVLSLCPLLAAAADAPAPAPDAQVAVVPFQGLGAEPALVERVAEALREQVGRRHFTTLGAEQTQTRQRAAAMCGEDVECLATLGQRLQAQWVVAFGLGRVGDGAMFTALVVDVAQSKKVSDYSERLPGFPDDPGPVALRAVSTLFVDLSPESKLVPKEPPLAVSAPVHKLRPYAWGFTIGTGVLAVAGVVLTVLAQQHYDGLKNVKPASWDGAASDQRSLNLGADLTVGVACAAAVTALALFLFDGPAAPATAPATGASR